jgi:hypothetical protein
MRWLRCSEISDSKAKGLSCFESADDDRTRLMFEPARLSVKNRLLLYLWHLLNNDNTFYCLSSILVLTIPSFESTRWCLLLLHLVQVLNLVLNIQLYLSTEVWGHGSIIHITDISYYRYMHSSTAVFYKMICCTITQLLNKQLHAQLPLHILKILCSVTIWLRGLP